MSGLTKVEKIRLLVEWLESFEWNTCFDEDILDSLIREHLN